jgi:hypothetical protein
LISSMISKSLMLSSVSGLPGIPCGIDESMWPRLKSPPKIILVLDAWFILLRDNSSSCRDVPLSDGGL